MNTELPTPAERLRNRCYGALPRARKAQWEARLNGRTLAEEAATDYMNLMLDDLLTLRKAGQP